MFRIFFDFVYFDGLLKTLRAGRSQPLPARVNAPDSQLQAVRGRLFIADGALP